MGKSKVLDAWSGLWKQQHVLRVLWCVRALTGAWNLHSFSCAIPFVHNKRKWLKRSKRKRRIWRSSSLLGEWKVHKRDVWLWWKSKDTLSLVLLFTNCSPSCVWSWLDSSIKTLVRNWILCTRGKDLVGPCCRSIWSLPRAYMCFTRKLIWGKQRQHNTSPLFLLLLLSPDLLSSTLQQHYHFLLQLSSSDSVEVILQCEWNAEIGKCLCTGIVLANKV